MKTLNKKVNFSKEKFSCFSETFGFRKKAEGTPIWLIIALILGIIVLVVIALGFTQGWNNLFQKLGILGEANSLSSAGQSCQLACGVGDSTSFNQQARTIEGLTDTQLVALGVTTDEIDTLDDKGVEITVEAKKGEVELGSFKVSGKGEDKVVKEITCKILAGKTLIDLCTSL